MDDISFSNMLEMQRALYQRNKSRWTPHTPQNAHYSVLWSVDELGEAIAIIKKKGPQAIMDNPAVRAHFVEEMCDVLMYLTDALDCFGVTPDEVSRAYRQKFERNMARSWSENDSLYEK